MPSRNFIVDPVTPNIGAIVHGVDLSHDLDEETLSGIRSAMLKHRVVFFEDQQMSPQQHRDFAARFGRLHIHPVYPTAGVPEIVELRNNPVNPTDNANWHTDVTFIEEPPMGAILYARQLPRLGGDTLWSNMRAAFLGLSERMQNLLRGLTAIHDFTRSFPPDLKAVQNAGDDRYRQAVAKHPPVVHPVIRTHPETGEEALFVNDGFTTRIRELPPAESDAILRFLNLHIQKPEYVVRWRWKPNAVAFWDNRITQHYAVDDYREERIMHRAAILGDKPYFRA
jgi:taurine dioxygenase